MLEQSTALSLATKELYKIAERHDRAFRENQYRCRHLPSVVAVVAVYVAYATMAVLKEYKHVSPLVSGLEKRLLRRTESLQILDALYWARSDHLRAFEAKLSNSGTFNGAAIHINITKSPEVLTLMKENIGLKAVEAVDSEEQVEETGLLLDQLLPQLAQAPASRRFAYHLRSRRSRRVDVVIGVPTARRVLNSYLIDTVFSLVKGLSEEDKKSTLIVVHVGEEDLAYVLKTAISIEEFFPDAVSSGLIEVVSPPLAYYPRLSCAGAPAHGDSWHRFLWRTKQNLDFLRLIAYAHSRGTYYLMMEDDVLAIDGYMTELKRFRTQVSLRHPGWDFVDYSIGSIGKLFRAAALARFAVYIQLLYSNMPFDWLLESYLFDKVCSGDEQQNCLHSKEIIRPKHEGNLFHHVGEFSTLKSRIFLHGVSSEVD